MNIEGREHFSEFNKSIELTPPGSESLLDLKEAGKVFSEKVLKSKEFVNQVEERKKLVEILKNVLGELPSPDVDLKDAISHNYLTENQVIDLYSSLTDLLGNELGYQRAALYIPFEFLPDADLGGSGGLHEAINKFKHVYMEAWKELLFTQDVRANFVDGDVLEVELRGGDLPRVVKAAHLIPVLVNKGLLKFSEVVDLLEKGDDEVLVKNVLETLPVLQDMGLINVEETSKIEKSTNPLVKEAFASVKFDQNLKQSVEEGNDLEVISPASISKLINDKLLDFESTIDNNVTTQKRAAWLKQEKKQEIIDLVGEKISAEILGGNLANDLIENLTNDDSNNESKQGLVVGISKAIEALAQQDLEKAQNLYEQYKQILFNLWQTDDLDLKSSLRKTFRRLKGLNIIDTKQLEGLGIKTPNLVGNFSENINQMQAEIGEVKEMVMGAEKNPELSQLIFPVALVFGSRIKGYGDEESDLDLAVIVRPDTKLEEQSRLRELLNQNFSHGKISGKVVEIWTTQTPDGLEVKDFEKTESSVAGSSWTHLLFGAVWEGESGVVKELRQKLLEPYLYENSKILHDQPARNIYLEEMERDNLQYRLMHKGYEKHHPSYGGIKTPNSGLIDGQSVFYDSGFRQAATMLYASKVFLPKISHPEI